MPLALIQRRQHLAALMHPLTPTQARPKEDTKAKEAADKEQQRAKEAAPAHAKHPKEVAKQAHTAKPRGDEKPESKRSDRSAHGASASTRPASRDG